MYTGGKSNGHFTPDTIGIYRGVKFCVALKVTNQVFPMKEIFASQKPNTLRNSTVQLVLVHLNTASSCNDFDILQLILTL